MSAVEAVSAEIDGVPMTGLVARVDRGDRPRAVVLALHGGGSKAAYWHGSSHPDQSLMQLAAGLGFTTVALDQPGYAGSAGHVDGWTLEQRADLLARTLAAVVDDVGAGVVVVAHSQGSQVAHYLAAQSDSVIGLEFSGTGLEQIGRQRFVVDPGAEPISPGRQTFEAIWGNPSLYPEGAMDRENTRPTPIPQSAYDDAVAWPVNFVEVAARITVPVRVTAAEYEAFWPGTPQSQARIAALFTAAPRVQTVVQPDAPHNLSLALAARAYHLHVLAFAEECALWARRSGRAGHPVSEYAATERN